MAERTARGVRRVNEQVIQEGRAIILTEEQADKLAWSDIPVGSIRINTQNGTWSTKLDGESGWVPGGVKNDGTINIAKDAHIITEKFIVRKIPTDDNATEFEYYHSGQKDEEHVRHGKILYANELGDVGELNQFGVYRTWEECKKELYIEDDDQANKYKNIRFAGFVFTLEDGNYTLTRNHLKVVIDGVLNRSTSNGGIIEISETRFCLTDKDLEEGMEIVAEYVYSFRLGNPIPRVFINNQMPEEHAAENGDIWIDMDGDVNDEDHVEDYLEDDGFLNWDRIRASSRPTSLSGYGIKDKVSYEGHVHNVADIVDFPTAMRANGGRADNANFADEAASAKYADRSTNCTYADEAKRAIADSLGRDITATYATRAEINQLIQKIDDMLLNAIPAGMISIYASNAKIPSMYLLCDGSEVSRKKYPALFAAIGTVFGEGDGETTFNLPNLIGKFPEGDLEAGKYIEAGLPNIKGTFGQWKWQVANGVFYTTYPGHTCNSKNGGSDPGWYTHLDASRANKVYGKSNTVQPEALTVKFIIKCK